MKHDVIQERLDDQGVWRALSLGTAGKQVVIALNHLINRSFSNTVETPSEKGTRQITDEIKVFTLCAIFRLNLEQKCKGYTSMEVNEEYTNQKEDFEKSRVRHLQGIGYVF